MQIEIGEIWRLKPASKQDLWITIYSMYFTRIYIITSPLDDITDWPDLSPVALEHLGVCHEWGSPSDPRASQPPPRVAIHSRHGSQQHRPEVATMVTKSPFSCTEFQLQSNHWNIFCNYPCATPHLMAWAQQQPQHCQVPGLYGCVQRSHACVAGVRAGLL